MTTEYPPTPSLMAEIGSVATEVLPTVRNPLTGEIVTDPAVLQRRPIAIKISNAPAKLPGRQCRFVVCPHRFDESVYEQQSGNKCLAYSVEIQLSGLGSAILFRGGLQHEVFWRRYSQREMINLANENGDLIPMQIGNTWYQVIPLDYPEPVTIE